VISTCKASQRYSSASLRYLHASQRPVSNQTVVDAIFVVLFNRLRSWPAFKQLAK